MSGPGRNADRDALKAWLEEIRAGGPPTGLPAGFAPRSTGARIGALLAAFVAGPLLGWAIAGALAPGSDFAQFVGVFAFPFVLGAGYAAWKALLATILMRGLGGGIARGVLRLLVQRTKPALEEVLPDRERIAWMFREAILAAAAFRRIGIAVGVAAGLLMAIAAPAGRGLLAFLVTLATCAFYGALLTRLAFAGYLMPPDEA